MTPTEARRAVTDYLLALVLDTADENEIESLVDTAIGAAEDAALERAARFVEEEDAEHDPDDLYTGRKERAAAIRRLKDKP